MSKRNRRKWKQNHFSSRATKPGSAAPPGRTVHPPGTWLGEPVPEMDEYQRWLNHQQNAIFSSFMLPQCVFMDAECPVKCFWKDRFKRCPVSEEEKTAIRGWQNEGEEGLF
jgi:hypothetical protein